MIKISKRNAVTVVTPIGPRIDVEAAWELRTALLELIENGEHSFVVDLAEVRHIDSSGLGAFVSASRALQTTNSDGRIRLVNSESAFVRLLELVRLNRVFVIYPSVEQAAGSFRIADCA